MNSPPVKPIAPSTHPALELIALAQLSPDEAGQRLRALLLANPNYFGSIPPTSFHAVLNIQEDTTYECISSVGCDAGFEQLRATIKLKRAAGYSGAARVDGSEEFVRFYVSYDGGAKWLDQGLRSVTVSDATEPRPLAYEVILRLVSPRQSSLPMPPPKVRAILSWNSPPPAGAPNWTPVWGNVMEADFPIKDARVSFSTRLQDFAKGEPSEAAPRARKRDSRSATGFAAKQNPLGTHPPSSTQADPQHQFSAYMFARSARHTLLGIPNPAGNAIDSLPCVAASPAFQVPHATEARFAAAF